MIICFRFVFPILYSIIFFFIISKITNLHSSFNFNLLLIFFFIFPNLLSISVSFLKKNFQKNILTLLISTIISFYLVEGILAYYFVNFNNLNLESKSKKKIEFDKRSLLEFLESYKAKNNEVVPYFTSENLIKEDISLLPLSGISNSTTVHCNESGFYSVYQSDRYGFNNPDIIWESSKRKIFLFGDSFVHGSCVNYNETIAGNISDSLKNYEVFNLGYSGNGPLKQYATLKEYLKNENISFIVWFYYEENELKEDIENELSITILKNYLENDNFSQRLIFKQNVIDKMYLDFLNDKLKLQSVDRIDVNINKEIKKIKLNKLIKFTNLRQILFTLKLKKDNLIIYSDILDKVNFISKINNSELIFVYLPAKTRYKNKLLNNKFLYSKSSIKKMVHEKNIKFLDFNEVLIKQKKPLDYFPLYGGHYNANGYSLLSKFIISNLN